MGDPILDGVQQRQDPVTPPTVPVDSGQTQQKEPGKFGKILGTVLGGLVRGGGLNYAADMETMLQQSARQQTQLLGVQMRVSDQTQQFTAVSNLLKAKHDGEMSAVNNFKSS